MPERRNITQPESWWAAFARAAKAEGLTLSEWMGKQCRKALPKAERDKLTDRPPAHRPKRAQSPDA